MTIEMMPDGIDSLGDWNQVVVDGKPILARVKVDINLPVELDIQKGTTKRKARLADGGDLPAKLTLTFTLATMLEVADFTANMDLLRPTTVKGKRVARTVKHPHTGLFGIERVVFTGLKSGHPDLTRGLVIEVEAVEYVAEPKKVVKAKIEPEADRVAWTPDGPDAQSRSDSQRSLMSDSAPSKHAATNLF